MGTRPLDLADHDEFLRLFTSVQPALRRFVGYHLPGGRQQEIEDVLQETALVLWRKFGEFDPAKSFTSWALGIAHYELRHSQRALARMPLALDEKTSELLARRAERSPGLEGRQSRLDGCLSKLDARSREALTLYYEKDLSTAQIAETFRGSVNMVRILLFRARHNLARCMMREGTA
ncbi:MAG: sigma-70 family RNA polymerase sigma factor [Planctomycetaceae bacterium]|nr:sigma-70 family RNA polymerase sigma factor [Planctomycetaceae bacterium]